MTAKEMFEELGYRERADFGNGVFILYDPKKTNIDVVFNKDVKVVEFWTAYDTDEVVIDMKLMKAINKQIEELGWS